MVSQPTAVEAEALKVKLHIQQLSRVAQFSFLEMGKLLKQARDDAHWSVLSMESFREYVEELDLPVSASYSWATRLIGVYEFVALPSGLTNEQLAEIGISKLVRLLPLARNGQLTPEWLDKAKEMSDRDLREELGHTFPDANPQESIICPRCGGEILNARWVSGVYAERIKGRSD